MAYFIFPLFCLLYLALRIEKERLEVTDHTHKMMILHTAHTGCAAHQSSSVDMRGGIPGA